VQAAQRSDVNDLVANDLPPAQNEVVFEVADFERAATESALTLVSKLYSIDTLSRSHVQLVVDSVREQLSGGFLEILEKKVIDALSTVENPGAISEIQHMFKIQRGMYDGLESEFKRLQVFENCGAFIAPESYVIGPSLDMGSLEPKDLTGQFMSLKKVLKAFLELPDVFSTIRSYMEKLELSDGTSIENFVQGKLWKEHIKPLFNGKFVLPLAAYCDEFEPCDPLGSHSGVYKLSGVYYEILCVPPEYRSSLDNILTALFFHAQDKEFGSADVYRPFLTELKSLESEGLKIVVEKEEIEVYFALCLFFGDNLGVHSVLGFVECFVANLPCRACRIPRTQAAVQVSLDKSLLRNRDNYESDVELNDVSATGVKERCLWNVLQSFHCTENLAWDIMHDLDEGVWDWDLCCILDVLIFERKRFSLEVLNDRVQGFRYGTVEIGNKPPIITKEQIKRRKLHCSASERQCLLRFLGLMIGDLVMVDGEDSDVWHFYNVAHDIVDFHASPFVTIDDPVLLKNLVEEHHALFLRLFPGEKLRPKHHHMLHHPDALLQIGPLKNVSTYPFEHKHKSSKQYANVNSNHMNVPYSLAVKAQLKLCYRLLSQKGFDSKFNCSAGELVSVAFIKDSESFVHLLPPGSGSLHCVKWVTVCGIRYAIGMVLVARLDSDYPVFGQIKLISLSENQKVAFVLRLLQTLTYTKRFEAYEVVEHIEWCFVDRANLVSHLPTELRLGPDGKKYVTFRHKF